MSTDIPSRSLGSERHQLERPTAITVVSVLTFIGALLTIVFVFTPFARQTGAWYPPYLGVTAVVDFICAFGLLKMRRWAVYTYTAVWIVEQILLVATGGWNIFTILLPCVVIAIGFTHLSEMR